MAHGGLRLDDCHQAWERKAFMRSIPLPDGLDLDNIDARFTQGELTLRFPKAGTPSPSVRKIDIE